MYLVVAELFQFSVFIAYNFIPTERLESDFNPMNSMIWVIAAQIYVYMAYLFQMITEFVVHLAGFEQPAYFLNMWELESNVLICLEFE